MVMQWTTPTVGGLMEAYNYYAGRPVDYGTKRWFFPGSRNEQGENSRVSHPESYTGGNVVRTQLCEDEADPSHPACSSEVIEGSPVYKSPIANECQSNHILLVTDGLPTPENRAVTDATNLVGGSCKNTPLRGNRGACAVELAQYMANNDMRPDATSGIPGLQTVTTHTIGFNLDSPWLEDIAHSSGGEYFTADSSDQLVAALKRIIDSVTLAESGSFVSPGITCLLYTSPSPRDATLSRMPSSA